MFPIAPGERKRVQIRYSQWLSRRDGTVQYRAPLNEANTLVEVDLKDARRVTELSSPSHHLSTTDLPRNAMKIRAKTKSGKRGTYKEKNSN